MSANEPRVNVLLAGDRAEDLLILESILGEREQNPIRVDSDRASLRKALEHDFAVILLDVQVPAAAFDVATFIREHDRWTDTPIIFLISLNQGLGRSDELGVVDYIFKPVDPDILRSKVSVFVDLFRKRQALYRQAQELARLHKQTELILGSAVEGIVGVSLDGLATTVNPAAARMMGRQPDEVIGKKLHDLVHPMLRGVITCQVSECELHRAISGRQSIEHVEDTFFGVDGSFPVEFSIAMMADTDGTPLGSVLTFRDVTEKRIAALAAEAERRYREAEAQNRAKDNFLATLSHELRTPMTSILGWLQFLRLGGYGSDEMEDALKTIESSARLQAKLIDDMLDVSRIVLAKFQVDLRPTRISDIIEAALTTARPAAAQREVRLNATIEEPEAIVHADASRMQQVIGNILSNAIKFTPPGNGVDLRLTRANGSLEIKVIDQGEGIDPTFLPHVFERLRQADGEAKRSGLGLGLAIARHIVELHNGEIIAASDGRGRGACFTVRLPAAELDIVPN